MPWIDFFFFLFFPLFLGGRSYQRGLILDLATFPPCHPHSFDQGSKLINSKGQLNWSDFGFVPWWLRVRVLLRSLEAYMVVNFRFCGISQGADKLGRTLTLIKKNSKMITLKGVAQLVRHWICSLKVTNSSVTNLRTTEGLHGY
jgi:hypothetical protein